MTTAMRRAAPSLRVRLLAATIVALTLALLLAGFFLTGLFRDHVQRQFAAGLTAQLDMLTARLEFDADGQARIDAQSLSDPRWSRPYSGSYWQLDRLAGGALQRGVLRSRSLWDATLSAPADALASGAVHLHPLTGPDGARLLLAERTVRREGDTAHQWRLLVAADLRETEAAASRFNRVLAASLAVLLMLLGAAAAAQVAVGLAPLRKMQRALADVHEGRSQRLDGDFPREVQPLIDDFNAVLDRNAEVVARARTQAGNLAHAIKTPLAVMAQAAGGTQRDARENLPAVVQEQVATARRQVDWHLARSRAAAAQALPGARTEVAPVVAGLIRVVERVHVARGIGVVCEPIAPDLAFAGEAQDLQEIVGNVLDNACLWARSAVGVAASTALPAAARSLLVVVEDDGPGIDAAQREAVLARGARLDESVPGSGLGLAIASELVTLYGGTLRLESAASGGLRVEIRLPAAARVAAPPSPRTAGH